MASAMVAEQRGRAGECETLEGSAAASFLRLRQWSSIGTLVSRSAEGAIHAKVSRELGISYRRIGNSSSWTAVCGWNDRPIRKKIIGHVSALRMRLFAGVRFLRLRGAFGLLHQVARQHRGSVLFQPLIEKRADLFTEIGCMTEARKLVALQRMARGGEKKLPRRLRCPSGHVDLPMVVIRTVNPRLVTVNSTRR
jgi:hypothetical protein